MPIRVDNLLDVGRIICLIYYLTTNIQTGISRKVNIIDHIICPVQSDHKLLSGTSGWKVLHVYQDNIFKVVYQWRDW